MTINQLTQQAEAALEAYLAAPQMMRPAARAAYQAAQEAVRQAIRARVEARYGRIPAIRRARAVAQELLQQEFLWDNSHS